ncbi:MAG: uroporphyrinogen decarboxylase [Rhabdochlamydiaceae bacterium]
MIFLDALQTRNQAPYPPVWLMRQAGRVLPSYRELRKKHSLYKMFTTPDLIADVTLLPFKELSLDAAIIFSDILLILEELGLKVHFPDNQSPFIETGWRSFEDIKKIEAKSYLSCLDFVFEGIKLAVTQLSVPLIGFAGGPFSVATYLLEKGHSTDLKNTKRFLFESPHLFHHLLKEITKVTILYLKQQIKSGVSAIQIFDSWAGLLPYGPFQEFSLGYLKMIIKALKDDSVPIIVFCRGSCTFVEELVSINPSCISFDSQKPLSLMRAKVPSHIAVQGNIDPYLLYGDPALIKKHARDLKESMKGDKGFIFNLGHGVLPDLSLDSLKILVDEMKKT